MTDIEGSTKLWDASPASAKLALERHDQIVLEQVAKNRGQVVESGREGDSVLAVFRQASDAVACALDAQRSLQSEDWPKGVDIRVRVAVHTGEARLRSGHYVGAPLYRCARLMAMGHGGQVLVSKATEELVADGLPDGVTLRDLGLHRLRDISRPEHVYQLVRPDLQSEFPALRSPENTDNLPIQLTSFVGRRAELSTVKRLIAESRLVTLTGAGGVGKTRVALEVARQTVDQYRDGAWLVELAPLANPDLVPSVVLAALGFGSQPSATPTQSLISSLKEREMICILDNCEHLLGACARLADALLRGCPQLRILATSRELLGISGETVWRVPSMATPESTRTLSLEELERSETVQLFLQRANAARPGFQLTNETADAVVRICRRLDGIPLAIELAAARIRTLPIRTIGERLDDRFQLLTGGSRVSLPRQRTLQATLDWSHSLLNADEKRLFRRLAVFRGGFTLEAAESIGTAGVADSVVDVLSSLIDKSLVIFEEGADHPPRFSLLETVREYAHHHLQSEGEGAQTALQHARYYLALADSMYEQLRGPGQAAWFTRVEDELDNMRMSFEWTLEHDPKSALNLTLKLERYWIMHRRGEGHDWLARSLAAAPEPDELRAHALYNASFWAIFQGAIDEARQLANECLALSRKLGNTLFEGEALCALAVVVSSERPEGWPALSLPLFEQAEELVREAADPEALARMLNNHGYVLYQAGDRERAGQKLQEAVTLSRQLGDLWLSAALHGSLADVEFAGHDVAAAEASWRRELELSGQIGGFITASEALTGLARLALANRQLPRCLQLLAAAVEFFRRTSSVAASPDPALVREAQETAHQVIGPGQAEAAWREGLQMSLTQAVRFGLGEPSISL
jgi:predicted ATPase/class 3 adenylate cyclase